ncbi:DUF5819 family protein [Streptantibioticus silvisoli]|uniref:DUF5819 family protein n=1 Tax=Streptantibioticus silvisoli TaxID=2705255 RepID=A0ABT6VUC0_9ACTN|nr:DUF5819 family protein [Streptantibioticus silvisoli]MDI5962069.1 DUF5819 family protein [Streptantibioticus silvisoli]
MCVTTALVHLCLVFLYNAPPNVVSQRYQRQINAWIYPYFEQNWQMFAPNPESAPQEVWARAATTSAGGTRRAGRWLDLTAQDTAAVRHDPFPSHTAQNMLRRAWSLYSTAQGTGDEPGPERARMLRRYLAGIAAQRLAAHGSGAFDAVQLRVDTTPIGLPGSPGPRTPSSTQILPWWQVTSHGR